MLLYFGPNTDIFSRSWRCICRG